VFTRVLIVTGCKIIPIPVQYSSQKNNIFRIDRKCSKTVKFDIPLYTKHRFPSLIKNKKIMNYSEKKTTSDSYWQEKQVWKTYYGCTFCKFT